MIMAFYPMVPTLRGYLCPSRGVDTIDLKF